MNACIPCCFKILSIMKYSDSTVLPKESSCDDMACCLVRELTMFWSREMQWLFFTFPVVFNFAMNDKRKSPVWNIIMWTCLFIGQGVHVCLYCVEWYAQIQCPRTGVKIRHKHTHCLSADVQRLWRLSSVQDYITRAEEHTDRWCTMCLQLTNTAERKKYEALHCF